MDRSIQTLSVLAVAGLRGATAANPAPDLASEGLLPEKGTALEQIEMHVEWAPGQEAVLPFAAEGEAELERGRIFHPDGRALAEFDARERAPGGLGSLELELHAQDPERLRSPRAQRRRRAGTRRSAAQLRAPSRADRAPSLPRCVGRREGPELSWSSASVVTGFELQLEQEDDDGLRIKLPPQQSSLQVPTGFLAPGTETHFEVAAIGANGNRTLTQVLFRTAP